jgi:hypothetical protein
LREKHINVVDYKPKGDKQERLISQIDLFEGGSVLLPKDAPWLEEFVAELLSFPGRHDDQVDALSQGLAWRREAWKAPLVLAYRRCRLIRLAGDQIGVEFLKRDKIANKKKSLKRQSTDVTV